MNKELGKLRLIIDVMGKIIDDPSKSLESEIGIRKDASGNWVFANGGRWQSLGIDVVEGENAVVLSTVLSTIGFVGAMSGGLAAAGTAMTATGVGAPIGIGLLAAGGMTLHRNRKIAAREKEEKDRMYREIIAKQQAAINKQNEKIKFLEEELRKANELNKANQKNIDNLKLHIGHLEEVVDLQHKQLDQFEKAA